MRKLICILGAFALITLPASAGPKAKLSKKEKADGWKLLFNGKNLDGWRTYIADGEIGEGWVVEDGMLVKQAAIGGGNIMTTGTYNDFEFKWEWNIATAGNNGVKYMILEERKKTIGHEYQLLDDDGHPDGKNGIDRQVASFYDVLPPADDKPSRNPGDWNTSRILVKGHHVEHWLNGAKVLEYECGSQRVLKAVQDSKFRNVEGFGEKVRGHILLTDHKDECKFRNLKIRALD